jgi:hypothetical protein
MHNILQPTKLLSFVALLRQNWHVLRRTNGKRVVIWNNLDTKSYTIFLLHSHQRNSPPIYYGLFPTLKQNIGPNSVTGACEVETVVARWLIKEDMGIRQLEMENLTQHMT